MKHLKRFNTPISNYIALTLFFFVLIGLLPANKLVMRSYNISAHEYHVLLFIVELPLAAIWFAAFFGYAKLRDYARSVAKTPEGTGFNRLAFGCQWLVWGLVLPSIVSLIINAIAANNHPGLHETAVIGINYLNLVFPLIAFTLISQGAHQLIAQGRIRLAVVDIKNIIPLFVVLGVLYCYLTFRHLDLHSLAASNNPYYLPVWILLLTITIPYLYAWCIGILAAYDISLFAKYTKGLLYRRALRLVAGGLILVIASLIGVQYLHIVTPRMGHLSLNSLLVTVYLVYVVNGASRLKKIEDI